MDMEAGEDLENAPEEGEGTETAGPVGGEMPGAGAAPGAAGPAAAAGAQAPTGAAPAPGPTG